MAISTISPKYFLGSFIPNVKILSSKVDEIINYVNGLTTNGLVVTSGSQSGSSSPTINQPSGTITSATFTTAALGTASIVLTNNLITANSKVFVTMQGYGGTGTPILSSATPTLGSATIKLYNAHATVALNAAITVDFFVVN
jgi:hypothetical protein